MSGSPQTPARAGDAGAGASAPGEAVRPRRAARRRRRGPRGASRSRCVAAAVVVWLVIKASEDWRQFAVVTLNGITLAALYFVVASGFTLIFGLMRVVNMAHGSLYLLGGYLALEMQEHWFKDDSGGLGLSLSGTGDANYALIELGRPAAARDRDHRRHRRADPAGVPALEPGPGPAPGADHDRAVGDLRRPDARRVRRHLARTSRRRPTGRTAITLPGDVRFGFFRGVVVLGAALLIGVGLWWLIRRTRFGKIVRAGVDDRDMVSALGINVQLVFAAAFFLGALLAGFGGVLGGTMISLQPGRGHRRSCSTR